MYNTNRQMGLTRPAVPQGRPAATPPPPQNNSPRPAPPRPAPPRPSAPQPQRPAPPSNGSARPAAPTAGQFLPPARTIVAQPQKPPQPPLGTGGFLPTPQARVQRSNNAAPGGNAPSAQYANAPTTQYANNPTLQNANRPVNPYGSMNAVAGASANGRPAENPYAQMRPVQKGSANPAPRAAQPAPPQPAQRPEPKANQVMTEKRNERNPAGDKTREIAALADRAIFRGQIVAPTGNGGLIMKPTGAGASDTLIHLPKAAANQLRERSGSLLKRSMENGQQGGEVQVAHLKGQWSATETKAPTKKIG